MTSCMKQKGHAYEYRPVMPSSILVYPLYQRELNQNKVKKIVAEWNYDLVNEPKLSQREDGKLYVFNGQHTIAAWREHEGQDTPIMCKVFRGITWNEEKDLFCNGFPYLYTLKLSVRYQSYAVSYSPSIQNHYPDEISWLKPGPLSGIISERLNSNAAHPAWRGTCMERKKIAVFISALYEDMVRETVEDLLSAAAGENYKILFFTSFCVYINNKIFFVYFSLKLIC